MSKLVGERITEAREAMGLSVNALAKLLGVSRTIIYDYESGSKQPSPHVFVKLCEKLEQPSRFFYLPRFESDYTHDSAHYRSLESLKPELRNEAGTSLKWIQEFYTVLEKKLSLPKLNFPKVTLLDDPDRITLSHIERVAKEVRGHWGIGDAPIPNLVKLLEMNGAIIARYPLDIHGMDAVSYWSEQFKRPFILLNADKMNYVRSRFDLAHELGHMILHRQIQKPAQRGTQLYKQLERQAHFFAASFLMPRSSWLRDVDEFTLTAFRSLKPKWKVSIIAQVMHSEALGAINANRKRSLMKQLSANKWRQIEPFDDQWEPEQPRLFKQATELVAKDGYGLRFILQSYPRRPQELSNITNLPPIFFSNDALPISFKKDGTDTVMKN